MAVLHLLEDKSVTHVPKPKPGWITASADGLDSNSSINRLATMGLMGESFVLSWT